MEYQSDFLLVSQARNGEEDACAALVKNITQYLSILPITYL